MSASQSAPFVRLDGKATSLIVDCRGDAPAVLHWGPRLAADLDPMDLVLMATREAAPCSPEVPPPLALTPLLGQGFPGAPGLRAHRDGQGWATFTRIASVDAIAPGVAEIVSVDDHNGLRLVHRLALAPDQDILVASTQLTNTGARTLEVEACAAPTLPLPPEASHLIHLDGRWSGEFQMRRTPFGQGAMVRENRRGRTSHDAFPGLIAECAPASEATGEVFGFHLGWSGNHRIHAETLSDARAFVQMGELFMPGELRLAPGATYDSPKLYAGYSDGGLSGLSRAYHDFVRARPEHARLRAKPRPVHYNTWEAVYFDHDQDRLAQLVDAAAAIGAERFVLDDGWFKGRRDDTAGLGDWHVDEEIYPNGLKPLVDRVLAAGMEFGLWVEPEMVNPRSDLFRAHPDWVLGCPPAPQLSFRNQLVLDFGRTEVRDYMYDRLDALLTEHPIAYLKWDMNRDISHPGGQDGAPGAHAHVLGLYAVLDRLRAAHPAVEIESCASGGGRADFAVLERTDRVWTSDSNDALDRLSIQKGASLFLPAELMGAHVGPTDCHITGRRVSMATRVSTALFGHFGIEANLLALTDEERAELAEGVALHKALRGLIHTGDLHRLDRPANENAFGVVATDGSEAVFAYTLIREQDAYFAGRLRLAGLDADARYSVRLVWPKALTTRSPLVDTLREGVVLDGRSLMCVGLQLPRMHPQASFILRLTRQG
ncbi:MULTISPECIES: alpha-galactosidase [Caulobacter]|uniref:alpha-galactosidase n=1 Tax=Caulobacter vibrioides OR37 TaxID=1292034 RepID=R0D1T0_CAUVI|nr:MULTISPECIES: alpha-galactosidase [Caulobacter]ENZ82596.1 alpha-galactosidase [Caulobacter vibrioides OR37]MBQ1563698.1 alpha-galactosidase [Caulobacter sp.]